MLIRYPPRLPEFVDRSRKLAREVLSSLEVRGAFLAGAPFAGLGTPMSDVDLHVVMTEPPDRAAYQLMVDGQRVDLRYWSETQFRQRIELCTRYTVSDAD